RDWSVTGVQTCALPISFLALRSKSDDELQRIAEGTPGAILQPMEARLARKVLADREAARRGKREEALEAEAGRIASEANRRALEIGRASCRERGRIWVG